MKIAISSGKGGTGKTFVSTNLSVLLAESGDQVTFIDCDVEAPNAHLFLKPVIDRTERMTIRAPVGVDPDKCTACGECAEACRYNAIAVLKEKVLIFKELCRACGACSIVCPAGAIVEGDKEIGEIKHGTCGTIELHYGLLKTAVGGMSPRLIRALKKHVGAGLAILDSPPGTACSTVETVKDADLCLLVADPTPFAIHDLKLSVNMCRAVGQEPAVVVNRAGLDDTELRAYCRHAQLEVVGEIPEARVIAEVYSVGDIVIEKLPQYRIHFKRILGRALELASVARPAKDELIEPLFQPGGEAARAAKPGPLAQRPLEIVVISGKGGTGKTSIAACFAQLSAQGVVADCDVDAADLHLVLDPQIQEQGDFVGGMTVDIDQAKCTRCGACMRECRFEAIELTDDERYVVDAEACEGCGTCLLVCEDDAVVTRVNVNGKWFASETRFGPMAHAILGHAEESSGRLVTLVRDLATGLAAEHDRDGTVVVMDGAPGTGCPVIASITGVRFAVVVTEPTVSGLHDLQRILDLTRHFRVQTGVIVNKADLNEDMTEKICAACEQAGAEVLGRIPYERGFTKAQIHRKTLLEYEDCEAGRLVASIWERIRNHIEKA